MGVGRDGRALHPTMSARAPVFSRFTASDMSDLIAYLRSLPSAVAHVGVTTSGGGRCSQRLPNCGPAPPRLDTDQSHAFPHVWQSCSACRWACDGLLQLSTPKPGPG